MDRNDDISAQDIYDMMSGELRRVDILLRRLATFVVNLDRGEHLEHCVFGECLGRYDRLKERHDWLMENLYQKNLGRYSYNYGNDELTRNGVHSFDNKEVARRFKEHFFPET